MTHIAFVPARCGSKAIEFKNIKPFCGKPLIYWNLKALQDAARIDVVYVATDCDEIERVVDSFGFEKVKVYRRSAASAGDTAATEAVMLEFIERHELNPDDLFILVQATSPFTTAQNFDEAIDLLTTGNYDSLLTCALVKRFFWSQDGEPINYNYQNRPRRQDFDGTFIENGAFYLNRVKNIHGSGNRLSGKIGIYQMPAHTMVELDDDDDWRHGEYLMRKYQPIPRKAPKMFLADIDGTLTDAGMYYTENGDEIKKFNTHDGMGLQLLMKADLIVGLVTAEDKALNERRAKKLGVDFIHHGVKNKLELVTGICKARGIELSEVAFVGDDINDGPLLSVVGWAACPASAVDAIKSIPNIHHLQKKGGDGAVREFAQLILSTLS